MEIMIAIAIYIVGVVSEGLIADRAQQARDEGLVLARLACIAGQRELAVLGLNYQRECSAQF